MAQHGYLREYDEGWDRGDDRDRERGDRDWRERDRNERDRGFMFGDRDRERYRDRGEDRGFFGRTADEARSWFRDDERDYPGGREQPGFGGDWDQARGRYSANPDDHYRSWRDRQMQALDRDYEDYCRERERQFHSDFDAWRSERGNQGPLRTGMTQTAQTGDPTGELDVPDEMANPIRDQSDPMATATLGTTTTRRR
jgi:hypothetical protein